MAKWRDEIEQAVNSVVLYVLSVQPALISEVLLKLLINVVFHVFPADADTYFNQQKAERDVCNLSCFTIIYFLYTFCDAMREV